MTPRALLSLAPLQVAQALIGFGAIAAFTRLMTPDEFGRYALALAASMAAHTLVFTWAEAAAFRFLPAAIAERRQGDHYATLLALAAALGAGAAALTAALLLSVGLTGDLTSLCAFAASAAILRFLLRIGRESDRARLDFARYATLETLYLTLGFAAGVAFLLVADLGAAAPFAGSVAAGIVVLAVDAPRLLAAARGGRVQVARARAYAGYGAPLALALSLDLCVQAGARFILAAQAGADDVGAYAAAFGLARPIDLVFMGLGAALSPLLLAAYERGGAEAVRERARACFALLFALGLPGAVGLCLLAKPLASALIGPGLAESAATALPWLALAGLIAGFNLYYWSEAFQLARRTGLRAALMLAPGAAQLALTAWLAPVHGAVGAAMAALASAALAAALLASVGRALVALPLAWDALWRAAVATALMAAALVALGPSPLALSIAVGATAYAAAALALDLCGSRTAASGFLQEVAARLRALLQTSFTDRKPCPRPKMNG